MKPMKFVNELYKNWSRKFNTFSRCLKMFFFQKVVLLGVKDFHGLHDDLKNIWKMISPGRYPVQKFRQPKKRRQSPIKKRKKITFSQIFGVLPENAFSAWFFDKISNKLQKSTKPKKRKNKHILSPNELKFSTFRSIIFLFQLVQWDGNCSFI